MIVYVFSEKFDGLRRFFESALGREASQTGPSWSEFGFGSSKLAMHRQLDNEPKNCDDYRLDLLVDDLDSELLKFKAAGATIIQGVQDLSLIHI